MSLLLNFSIRFKILAIVMAGVVGLAVTLSFNYNATSSNAVVLEKVRDIYFPVLEKLDMSLFYLGKIKENYTTAVIAGDEDTLADNTGQVRLLTQSLHDVAALDRRQQQKVDQLLAGLSAYIKVANEVSLGMIDERLDLEAAKPLLEEMNGLLAVVEGELSNFRNFSYQRFTGAIDGANESAAKALVAGTVVGVITALLLGAMGLIIGGSITRNIASVVNSLKTMASGDGDLTTRLKSESNDEIGTLVGEFNTFVDKLQAVIVEVMGSTVRVAEAAGEMKRVSEVSVVGMNSQQQEINQAVAAIGEMTRSVESVSDSAGRAANAARTVSAEADAGKQVVEESMQAINCLAEDVEYAAGVIKALESHSESIDKVLNVIREIAEQTNLLALNAAIEAARAGEQGRGFAVVADEVRTLANRTHESTREINEMISSLQTGAQNAVQTMVKGQEQARISVEQAAKVGESLARITLGISEIGDMNVQIASMAEEQTAVTHEINNNIVNLGQVVEQVAEDARVAEGDSDELANLAKQLKGQVSVFKV